ncbi:hypothetical protein [Mesorhizobium sp.]|uniref:hypothetical protein n=1 Tax=Mesorhizobium sp. TaxID=1871066 RepID=UPI000FE9387C|nr:hypothetical protein [Mesorhizobium sp.]RWH78063.1 MAG: hypothetical protein EOQ85_17245 [Mesorhizobium sp.]
MKSSIDNLLMCDVAKADTEVRNPRWILCRECHPGMAGAFAPLKEICPDRATPELMEVTARLGSMLPYRQAAKVLTDFLPTAH